MRQQAKWFILLLVVAVIATGCGSRETSDQAGAEPMQGGSTNQTEQVPQPEPKAEAQERMTIQLFYTDDQLENLIAQDKEIVFADAQEKLEAALAALQQNGENGAVSLWKNVEFTSVVLDDGDLTIDLTLPEEARFGAPGELLALESIKNTVFQFEEIKTLDILVDGEAVDSLMGHVDLEHPFTKQ
ncbi:GerMN domain-containing protein [Paenibacillus abyssi]|nr:GerMN domain-containing protein [Paenibacillus abyssi]